MALTYNFPAASLPNLLADDEMVALGFVAYLNSVFSAITPALPVYLDFDWKTDVSGNPILDSNGNLQSIDLSDQCVLVRYINHGATGHLQTPNVTNTGAPQGEEDWFVGTLTASIQVYRPNQKPSTLVGIVRQISQYRAMLRAAMLTGVLYQATQNNSALNLGYYQLIPPFTFAGERKAYIENLCVDVCELDWRIGTRIVAPSPQNPTVPNAWPS